MDYGRLLGDAWVITWRHRFLWILGLFSGSSAGACSSSFNFSFPGQWGTGGQDFEGGAPAPDFEPFTGWINENPGLFIALILAAVAVIFLIWLVLKVVSLIAQGGIVRATADLGSGDSSSLGEAVQAGLRYFWRFLGLWLLLLALTIAIGLAVLVVVVLAIIVISVADESIRFIPIVLAILFGIAVVLVAIPASILFSIVVGFAQRAIVVEDVGPVSAIRSGARLLRAQLGPSLLVWLINVAVGIVAGLATIVVLLATIAPLAVVGFLVYVATGMGIPTIVYIVLASLVAIAVLWGLLAIVNTYFWSYWTIAYLRLGEVAT